MNSNKVYPITQLNERIHLVDASDGDGIKDFKLTEWLILMAKTIVITFRHIPFLI